MIPTMEEFKKAQTIKINPDKPQEQARYLTIDVSTRSHSCIKEEFDHNFGIILASSQ